MTNREQDRSPLQDFLQRVDAELQGLDFTPFSEDAFTEVKRSVYQYITWLVSESMETARRNNVDIVSATHVQRTEEYLIARRGRRLYRNIETTGAVSLGAGLSALLALPLTNNLESWPVIVTAMVAIVGAGLLAYGFANGD